MAAKREDQEIEKQGRFVVVGGTKLDLKGSLPFTMGDAKALNAAGVRVVSGNNVIESPDNLSKYLAHFVRKLKSDASDEQIDALSTTKTVACVLYIQHESQKEPENPS